MRLPRPGTLNRLRASRNRARRRRRFHIFARAGTGGRDWRCPNRAHDHQACSQGPRQGELERREVRLDRLYSSPLVTKFISTLMRGGKRSTAERIMYGSLSSIQEKTGDDPLKVFKKAVENVKPALEVKSRRVGGSNYQVPVEVNPNRRLSLSIRWLVGYARSRGDGKTMQEKLANELMDAANLRGGAVKKREDTHRMAEANKAFAHYRW